MVVEAAAVEAAAAAVVAEIAGIGVVAVAAREQVGIRGRESTPGRLGELKSA